VDPFVDVLDELLPVESALIGRVAAPRLLEFRAGRHCARAALARLGVTGPVLRAPDRSPIWPEGVVGSIAHTRAEGRAFCGAVVARSSEVESLGLDVEFEAPLESRLWKRILREREVEWISALPEAERGLSAMFVFSAKESVYKCQHRLSRRFLEFADVEIDALHGGLFSATLLRDAAPFSAGSRFEGRYVRRQGLLATGVALRAR
jgi:4'-phosphopantetheinyl transferase EntD